MKDLISKLSVIQKTLKAPKSQMNTYGGYAYRNQEDILEAVKPLLGELVLTVSDEIVSVGDRIYVKATSKITDGTNEISNTAFAREPEDQKGMNAAQITGSASSYARKYSLNGLFLIDDTKDADSDEVTKLSKSEPKSSPKFARKPSVKESEPEVETTPTTEAQPEEPTTTAPTRRSFRRK